jgi:hypothetical protein
MSNTWPRWDSCLHNMPERDDVLLWALASTRLEAMHVVFSFEKPSQQRLCRVYKEGTRLLRAGTHSSHIPSLPIHCDMASSPPSIKSYHSSAASSHRAPSGASTLRQSKSIHPSQAAHSHTPTVLSSLAHSGYGEMVGPKSSSSRRGSQASHSPGLELTPRVSSGSRFYEHSMGPSQASTSQSHSGSAYRQPSAADGSHRSASGTLTPRQPPSSHHSQAVRSQAPTVAPSFSRSGHSEMPASHVASRSESQASDVPLPWPKPHPDPVDRFNNQITKSREQSLVRQSRSASRDPSVDDQRPGAGCLPSTTSLASIPEYGQAVRAQAAATQSGHHVVVSVNQAGVQVTMNGPGLVIIGAPHASSSSAARRTSKKSRTSRREL